MKWTSVDLGNCSVLRTLGVIGKPWAIAVLREVFNDVRRFEDFQQHLGVSRSVLSRRLNELVDGGLLDRTPYREDGGRERFEYRPTEKAWGLYPVMVGLMQWGDRYLADGDGPPVHLVDRRTGRPVITALVTDDSDVCAPSDIAMLPGPSLRTLPDGG